MTNRLYRQNKSIRHILKQKNSDNREKRGVEFNWSNMLNLSSTHTQTHTGCSGPSIRLAHTQASQTDGIGHLRASPNSFSICSSDGGFTGFSQMDWRCLGTPSPSQTLSTVLKFKNSQRKASGFISLTQGTGGGLALDYICVWEREIINWRALINVLNLYKASIFKSVSLFKSSLRDWILICLKLSEGIYTWLHSSAGYPWVNTYSIFFYHQTKHV